MITRNNYELYIIDFYDEKLNEIQVEELRAFFEQNPDLKEEFELFSISPLPKEEVVFTDKKSLKKNELPTSEILIAFFENDLNASEKESVEKRLMSNPKMAQELEIIKKTRVLPDYTILFQNKESLKRKAKVISFSSSFSKYMSIAASIILIALAYFVFRENRHDEKMMANDKNTFEMPANPKIENQNKESLSPQNKNIQHNPNERRIESYPNKKHAIHNYSPSLTNVTQEKSREENPQDLNVPRNELTLVGLPKQSKDSMINLASLEDRKTKNEKRLEKTSIQAKSTVTDLTEIFTPEELKELGLAGNVKVKNDEPASILDFAAAKLKHFSDAKEITLNRKENSGNNATTYAINVGSMFSLSHTSSK